MSVPVTATTVERTGRAALAALMVLGIGVTAALVFVAPPMALFVVPIAAVAAAASLPTVVRPSAGLVVTLVLSIGLLGYGRTANVAEALFGVYFVGFVGLWYVQRLLAGEPIVRSRTDAVLALFAIGGLIGGVVLGAVSGARPEMLLGETRSFMMLLLYFPIREAVRSEPGGVHRVVAAFLVIGLASAAWNAYTLWSAFHSASELWEIIDIRTAYGESTLATSFLLGMGLLVGLRRRPWAQVAVAAVVSALFVGLVMTKSRGYWVATIVGGAVTFALLPRTERARVFKLGFAVAVGIAVAGTLFLGKYLSLLVAGIAKRFLTLGSATTADVSFINRFYESAAAWELIKENPIAGYGFGVAFSRYDLVFKATMDWSFIHNGYVGMWYKLGLWGLALMLTAWVSCIAAGVRASRAPSLPVSERILAATCVGALLTLVITMNTSNPFLLADQTLVVTVAFGLASGLVQRAHV